VIIQNKVGLKQAAGMYFMRVLQAQDELIDECRKTSHKQKILPDYPLIYYQEYKHDDGIMVVYSNDTKDRALVCKIAFELKGLKLIDQEGTKIMNVILGPDQWKSIQLKKTEPQGGYNYNFKYTDV